MGLLTKSDIKKRTEEYWDLGPDYSGYYECYVQELLGRELTEAKRIEKQEGSVRLRPLAVDTLAMTVGETFEPLLQAVCVHKPKRLLLVLNKQYSSRSGEQQGRKLMELVAMLPTAPDLPSDCRPTVPTCEPVYLKEDTPTQVFKELHQALSSRAAQSDQNTVNAVDITGAKKSMVVGAFMYAAYTGLPVTYVDFDKYSPQYGRPYGYTCVIGQIRDPYQVYELRRWGRVHQLYRQGHFRAARRELSQVYKAMSSSLESDKSKPVQQRPQLFATDQLKATQKFLDILTVYEAWNEGDHKTARRLANDTGFSPPDAVQVLGAEPRWPSIRIETRETITPDEEANHLCAIHDNMMRDFFKDARLLLAYARDELYKLERLPNTNEDNRSALLRAAALDELLLKARLVGLWHTGKIEVWRDPDETEPAATLSSLGLDDDAQAALLERLMLHDSEWLMRATLRHYKEEDWTTRAYLPLKVKYKRDRRWYNEFYGARPVHEAYKLASYEDGTGLNGYLLTQLRNRAIHTYLYITQTVAQAAVRLARNNLEDLEKNWLPSFSSAEVGAKPWQKVLTLCGIDFLPPIPIDKEDE